MRFSSIARGAVVLMLACGRAAWAADLKVGLCGVLGADWGMKDVMSFYLALEYWRHGPPDLAGGLIKPPGAAEFNISVTIIDSACSGQASFESAMSGFVDAGSRPDVIVGCLCSGASLSVGRFSTAFGVPMLATASQSSQLSDKAQYPYLFRWCTTELTDADMHSGLLTFFGSDKITVIYMDSQRAVKQKDRLLSLPGSQGLDALVVRLPDVDMALPEGYAEVRENLRKARLGTSYIFVGYLASDVQTDNDAFAISAAYEVGLLNNYSIMLLPETLYGVLNSPDLLSGTVIRHATGSMLGRAQPVMDRFQAWKGWAKTVNMSTLTGLGMAPTSDTYELNPAWLSDPDTNILPWHTFRVDATIGLLTVMHQHELAGQAMTRASLDEGVASLQLAGIMGDLSWDASRNRQGLVYEIVQLQSDASDLTSRPSLLSVGSMVLVPDAAGLFSVDLDQDKMSFGTPPRPALVHVVAPPCEDGTSKPDPFSMPSECAPCPKGRYSSSETGHICLPCPAGLYGPTVGQSRCLSCALGSFTNTSEATSCALCAAGTAADISGATACHDCTAGKFAELPGSDTCTWCEVGRYQPGTGKATCLPCDVVLPGSMTDSRGAESQAECKCSPDAYFFREQANSPAACEPCPVWLTCPGGNGAPFQGAGFRTGPQEFPGATPQFILRCENNRNCPSGLPLDSCPDNRDGKACDRCAVGYTDEDGICVTCEGRSVVWPLVLACLASVIIACGLVAYSVRETNVQRQTVFTIIMTCGLVVNAIQCLGAFSQMSVEWVEPLKSLRAIFKLFALDADVLNPGCVLSTNNPGPLYLLSLLMYPLLAALLLLGFGVAHACRVPVDKNRVVNAEGMLMLVCYLSLSMASLTPWQCQENPDGSYSVQSKRNVICFESSEHSFMLACSVIGSLVYIFGFLALVSFATLKYPQYIVRPRGIEFLRSFDFLFNRFAPSRYYYGVIFSLRSLAVAFIPVLFVNEPQAQIMLLALVVIGLLAVESGLKPWRVEMANYLASLFSVCLGLVIVAGSMLVDYGSAHAELVLQGFLIAVIFCMFGSALMVAFFFAYRALFPPLSYGAFLCHHKAGAGVLARLFKIIFAGHCKDEIFIDSDHLDNLDGLFGVVAYDVRNLVVLWTKETLNRMWCAGEITTAVRRSVHILPVACGGHEPPSDQHLERLQEIWSEGERTQLAALGIEIEHIKSAYGAFRQLTAFSFVRSASPEEQEDKILQCLRMCKGLRQKAAAITGVHATSSDASASSSRSLTGSFSSASGSGRLKGVVIVGNQDDREAVSACQVLQHLLLKAMQEHVVVLQEVLEGDTRNVKSFAAVLTRGVLENPAFAASLCYAQQSGIGVVPVNCDPSFCFPSQDFWDGLTTGKVMNLSHPAVATLPAERISSAYQTMFKDIAKVLSVQSSDRILKAQVEDMLRAFDAAAASSGKRVSVGSAPQDDNGGAGSAPAVAAADNVQLVIVGDEEEGYMQNDFDDELKSI